MGWMTDIHRRVYESRVLYDHFKWWGVLTALVGAAVACVLLWKIPHGYWANASGLITLAFIGLVEFWLVSAKNYQNHRDAVTAQAFALLAGIHSKRWSLYPDPRVDPVGVVRQIAEEKRDRASTPALR